MLIINTICICFVWGKIRGGVHVKLWMFKGGEGITKIGQKQKKKRGGGTSFGHFVIT